MLGNSSWLAPVFSTPEIAAIFSDRQFIENMLRVEVALAQAQEKLGIIPTGCAARIAQAADDLDVDMTVIQQMMETSGIPTLGLIAQLREQVGGDAASYVHWGATTQDIMDTALVLQIRAALEYFESNLSQIINNLAALATRHRTTVMAGRTRSQQAVPISFGWKVAGWIAPLLRHQTRLAEIRPRVMVVQFGGAAGTLASLGNEGIATLEALAADLGLLVPPFAWHTQRDTFVELASWLSLVSGSLAKIAQDVILMAQSEVAEVTESVDTARGGSSTMPQKSNPVVSEAISAAARTNASLLAALHQALIQEHERAAGSWQIEWLTLPSMFELTASALQNALFLSEHLVVNEIQMHANVAASNGLMLAEALNLALAPVLGRTAAKAIVQTACQTVLTAQRHLVDVVQEQVDAELDWESLRDESNYLGASDVFIDRVLQKIDQ